MTSQSFFVVLKKRMEKNVLETEKTFGILLGFIRSRNLPKDLGSGAEITLQRLNVLKLLSNF